MSSSTITFDFSEDSPLSTEQSIAFNVQITESIGNSYLLRLSDETNVLKIVANSTGQLFVKENDSTVLQTDVETENDSYHFVCLTYNTVNKTVTLKVDDKTYNATLNVSFSDFKKLYFMDGIVCSLTNIIIPINGVISDDDYGKYKDSFNYLLTLNESKVVEYNYNAWGEVTSIGGTLEHINPFRYKGYYYDSDIKMYYCKIGSTIFQTLTVILYMSMVKYLKQEPCL